MLHGFCCKLHAALHVACRVLQVDPMRRMLRDRGALLDALFIPPRPELVRTSAPIGTGGASCNTVQLVATWCNMVQHSGAARCNKAQPEMQQGWAAVGPHTVRFEWY